MKNEIMVEKIYSKIVQKNNSLTRNKRKKRK